MEPRPVTQSEKPKYPTRRDVLTAAAVLAVAGVTGSLMVPGRDQGGEGSGAGHKTGGTAADKTGAAGVAQGKLLVAPLFVHGTGRGVVGCIVVTPPAFLSEEEGAQIIREELATKGVRLSPGGTLAGVRMPRQSPEPKEVKGASTSRDWAGLSATARANPCTWGAWTTRRRWQCCSCVQATMPGWEGC